MLPWLGGLEPSAVSYNRHACTPCGDVFSSAPLVGFLLCTGVNQMLFSVQMGALWFSCATCVCQTSAMVVAAAPMNSYLSRGSCLGHISGNLMVVAGPRNRSLKNDVFLIFHG